MSRFMFYVAGAFFTAGLAAYAVGTKNDLLPFFGAAVVLSVAGLLLQARRVRRRLPWLQTFPERLSQLYQKGLNLRSQIKFLPREAGQASYGEWESRISAFDAAYWKLLERHVPEQAIVFRREQAQLTNEGYNKETWITPVLDLLEARLHLLDDLLDRELGRR